jgi:cation:H+ antiporter
MNAADLVLLVGAFFVILAGAELFTNGIEWFGRKLELAEGAVGSVLAAVGTALPETMIPIVAIVFSGSGSGHGSEVAVGAILGAPFMLSTLAMFVTGVAVVAVSRRRPAGDVMPVDPVVLSRDVGTFAAAYAIAVGAAFLPASLGALKPVVGLGLLGIYVVYVKAHFDAEASTADDELAPLRLRRLDRRAHRRQPAVPRLRIVTMQVIVAVGLIVGGAILFVDAVDALGRELGVNETLLALVVAPIATELPEKLNSVIWVRQGKDTLALGNITGAMVFQSTIPTVVALVLAGATWTVSADSALAFASAGIAFLSTAVIFVPMIRTRVLRGRRLLVGGAFYLVYVGIVVAQLTGLVELGG